MRPVIPCPEASDRDGQSNRAALFVIGTGTLTALVVLATLLAGPRLLGWWTAAGRATPAIAVPLRSRPPPAGRPWSGGPVSGPLIGEVAVAPRRPHASIGEMSAPQPVERVEASNTFALTYSAGFQVSGCLPTPDGSLVAVRLWDPNRRSIPQRIGVWDAATGAKRGEWDTGTLASWLQFSPDGTRLSGFDNSRRVWSAFSFPDGRVLRRVDLHAQFPSRFSAWAFFDDGAGVAILDPDAAIVRVYDIRSGVQWVRQFSVIVTPKQNMTATADGRTLALWPPGGDAAVRFYDLRAGTLSATQAVNPGAWEYHFAAGGTQLLEVPRSGLALVDVRTGLLLASPRVGEGWWGTKVAGSGDAAVSDAGQRWVDLNALDSTVTLTLQGADFCSNNFGISDDGRHVAAVVDHGPCAVWDLSKSHPER